MFDSPISDCLEFFFTVDHSCWIGWRIQQDHLGLVCPCCFQLLYRCLEVIFFCCLESNRCSFYHLDLVYIRNPARCWNDDFITWIDNRCKESIKNKLGSSTNHYFIAVHSIAIKLLHVVANGILQFWKSRCYRIKASATILDRCDCCFLNIFWSRKVRLTQGQT